MAAKFKGPFNREGRVEVSRGLTRKKSRSVSETSGFE